MSSAVGTFIADDAQSISQVRISPAGQFQSIPSAATTPTPPTQTPRERRRNAVKERLRRNGNAILDQIEARLRVQLSPTA